MSWPSCAFLCLLSKVLIQTHARPHARLPAHTHAHAQGIANICWSVAVLQLSDEALLLWCRRLLASRLTSMNWSCLRQVQQFLLTLAPPRVGYLGLAPVPRQSYGSLIQTGNFKSNF